jgi:predicted Zn-dependent protease
MSAARNIQLFLTAACVVSTLLMRTASAQDTLSKKNLSKIGQSINRGAAQIKQAASTVQASLPKTNEGIPLIGDMSDSDEQALGREVAGRLLAANPVEKNDSLQRYVNLIGTYIAQQGTRPTLAWTFGIIESDDINAFALPGGYIVVTRGLYRTLRNEAELAGVLGHEIAHVNLRHHVRLMQKERLIAEGADFLAGKTKQDAIKALAGSGAEICARTLDRNAEFECDRIGLEYAARAGYDPFAYLDALDRMGVNTQTDRLSLLYKTHPHPRDRIAALEGAIVKSWPSVTGAVPQRWVSAP